MEVDLLKLGNFAVAADAKFNENLHIQAKIDNSRLLSFALWKKINER
jgi:hypothetical protein